MTTITRNPAVEVSPSIAPVRRAAPQLEVVHGTSPRRAVEKWFLGLMVVSFCVFGIALATYVLRPAISTTSSTSTWNQDGP